MSVVEVSTILQGLGNYAAKLLVVPEGNQQAHLEATGLL